jgi:hypothetical protein
MSESNRRNPPQRGTAHAALAVFLGEWRAEGRSYGHIEQQKGGPRGKPMPWKSTHTGRWHSGEYFLIQDEHAVTGTAPFDTLSIMGWDAENGCYFARTFENHGFERRYDVTVDGRVWTFAGAGERARIVFSDDGATQTITWEWRPEAGWLPLCDRIATKVR